MKLSCIKEISFCVAHRIYGHENKCANLHGHNYKLNLYVSSYSSELDKLGRIVDFSQIKEKAKGWIDTNWDHNTIIFNQDEMLLQAIVNLNQDKEPYIVDYNTTAEQMALYLINEVFPNLFKDDNFEVYKLDLFETDTSWVTVDK